MRHHWILLFTLFIISGIALADEEESLLHLQQKHAHFYGYLDSSYNYLLRNNHFVSGRYNRINDREPNGFTLHQLTGTLDYLPPEGLGGLISGVIGRDANVLAPAGYNPNVFNIQNVGLAVPQAFLQLQHHQYGVKAGLLLTLAGIELYESPKDFNFSRSILDGYAQPGSHLGIRGVDNWNDHLSLILGVGNGWSTIRQPYKQNHFECGINYNAPHIFNILVNGYSGLQYLTDRAGSGPTSRRNLLDIFGTLYITEKLNLAANYDYAMQNQAALANGSIGKATWQGIAGYINYQWAEKWLTSLRSEILADTQGYRTGVRQNWREITLTLRYFPVKALEFRAETRHDFSNVNAFRSKSGTAAYNNQQSFGLEGIYNF